jgi:hypothetical protein
MTRTVGDIEQDIAVAKYERDALLSGKAVWNEAAFVYLTHRIQGLEGSVQKKRGFEAKRKRQRVQWLRMEAAKKES